MTRPSWGSYWVSALLALVLAAASAAHAAAETGNTAVRDAPSARALNHEDLEAWLDGYLPYALQRGDVAGAVVVVVKDGEVLLQKGYGYADRATRRPVDPQNTLFRPGSVSKLITWTAVMQLVEAGRVDLDADINAYLDFKIPPFAGRPITLRHLMTHTPGFEDVFKDLVSADPKGPPPLGDYLRQRLPTRIFPPGQIPAYSNYGVALAGYIVQRVSGQSFDDYVEGHIFGPLGMHQASFRQPLPAALLPQMSSGYGRASEAAKPYEMFAIAPAGSSAITGADMARFMIAHLQEGEYDGRRILRSDTAHLMHDTPFTVVSPSLNRMLLGFYTFDRNGHRIIGHDGDTVWFHSVLQLFIDDRVGLFASFNSVGQDGASRAIRRGLTEGFADRYFPGTPLPAHVDPGLAKQDAAALVGNYDGSQWKPTSFLSLLNLFSQARVTADEAGHIFATPALSPNGQPRQYEEIGSFVWREVGGQTRLAAKVVNGRPVMWSIDEDSPYLAYLRTPVWRDTRWLVPLLGLSIVALLLTLVGWPVPARQFRRVRAAGGAAAVVMLAWLTTVAVMAATFSVTSALDPWLLCLHLLSIVVFPLAAALALLNAWATCFGRKGSRSALASIWSGVLAVSCLTLLWVALIFHLMGLSVAF